MQSESFDLFYSKGVLVHVENKKGIFKECLRLLKPGGLLIITDCLSFTKGIWGPHIAKLVELEHLLLFAETEDSYLKELKEAGFTILSVRDDSASYQRYNQAIAQGLRQQTPQREAFLKHYSEKVLEDSALGYESIA